MVSAPLNRYAHPLYEKLAQPARFRWSGIYITRMNNRYRWGMPEVLIMGMGRTGTAAYEYLQHKTHLAALDSDPARVRLHQEKGNNVFFADAEDQIFWHGLDISRLQAVLLCMSDMEAKLLLPVSSGTQVLPG